MPHVEVEHSTDYLYRNPVGLGRHRLMVRPQDSHDLRLREATLAIEPAPASTRWAHDVFGNSICMLDWDGDLRTERLRIVSRLSLDHYPGGPSVPRATLDPAAELFPFSYASDEVPDLARLTERQLADPARLVDSWARRFLDGGGHVRTLAMLEAMTEAIRSEFTYLVREEEGTQAPAATLTLGQGSCRDFALLMMEAARSLGLAARFVTGYLYETQPGSQQGGGATHAWCSVYLPGAGWVEYDPTNGLIAGRNLIRVGVTRTPEQAVPVGGAFIGETGDALHMIVDVTVRTETELQAAA